MAIVRKVTFEISEKAAGTLREIKKKLEDKRLPVKQWNIVEYLILNAELRSLTKHFEAALVDRIGEEQAIVRQRRRAHAAAKRNKMRRH